MTKLKKVLIMAGGTGGHVFPGLAVAKKMRDQGTEVHWLGTPNSFEARVVPEAGFPLHTIAIDGIRRKGMKSLLLAPFKLISAVNQAYKIIRQLKPDVVLGMGGFASGPGGIASWLLGIPLVIHEQNAKAGMTNAYLARVAKKILQGFPNTFKSADFIGNPVRTEISNVPAPAHRFKNSQSFHVLILGGSSGALAINELLPKALALLAPAERPHIVHQTGEKHLEKTKQEYQALNVTADIVPFIQDMSKAYADADLVVCRSGALTVAELCAVGVGAILIPFPFAVDDHQTANANFMVKENAAILVQQKDLTPEKLATLLKDFSLHKEKCIAMANAAYGLRRSTDAADTVVAVCSEAAGL